MRAIWSQLPAVRGSERLLELLLSFVSSEPFEFSIHATKGLHFFVNDQIPALNLCFLKRQGFLKYFLGDLMRQFVP